MISNAASLPDWVIPNGQTTSQVFNSPGVYGDSVGIALYGTDGAYAETYTIEGNKDQQATNASSGWMTLQGGSPAADLNPPAAGKSKIYQEIVFAGSLRLKASGAVAATRTWQASKVWTT